MANERHARWGLLALLYSVSILLLIGLKHALNASDSVDKIVTFVTVSSLFLFGAFYAFKCFFTAVLEAKNFRARWKHQIFSGPFGNPPGTRPCYEEKVPVDFSSYFRGVFLKQLKIIFQQYFLNILNTCKACFRNLSSVNRHLSRKPVLHVFDNVMTLVCTAVCGALLGTVLCIVLFISAVLAIIGYYAAFGAALITNSLYHKLNRIETRCTNGSCKANFDIPVYACPKCGILHQKLRPSKWGIFRRKCVCGIDLPCLVHGKTFFGNKFLTRADFPAFCPVCHQAVSGQSRPLGVALLGGVNAGKSTFQTAFLFRFIEESAIHHKLDVQLPDDETNLMYDEIKKYFRGQRAVPETRPDEIRGYDVKAFNFSIDHDSFSEKRLIQIYDMPGEAFEQDNAQDRMDHFRYVEGLIFLLDPYSLNPVAGERAHDDMRIAKMDIDSLTSRLIDALQKVPDVPRSGGKFALPVAVCINKVDTLSLRNKIGIPASERLMQLHPDEFKSRYDAMDYLCRAFMCSNGKGNAVMTIDQNFSTVHFFSCSSMGYVPQGGQRVRFTPENVEAAVFWLFSRADKRFDKVFSDYEIRDIPEKKKELGRKQSDYYQEITNDMITIGGKDDAPKLE